MYIVAEGNAFNGLSFVGPFSTFEEAALWANKYNGALWLVIEVTRPEVAAQNW